MSFAIEAARSAIDAGRIGRPVAVELLLYVVADHGRLESLLAAALDRALHLLGAEPARLWARGGVESGHVCVQVACREGQTAVVAAGSPGSSGLGQTLLLVVGTKGILSWEDDALAIDDALGNTVQQASGASKRLGEAVRQSLAQNRAIDLEGPGDARKPTDTAEPKDPARRGVSTPGNVKPSPLPIGVLLVGGSHTHQEMYAAAFAKDRRARLVGLTDAGDVTPRRRELNERLARQLQIPYLDDYGAALERKDVQVVSVCAEPQRRGPLIVRAAEAGKHLYLDKPLAASLAEARAIEASVRAAGVISQMFSLVHTPAGRRLKRLVDSGQLGQLVTLHCDQFFAKGQAGSARSARPRREAAVPTQFETIEAKRELYNVGVYPLVLLVWLLGRRALRVFATTGNYFFAEHEQHDMEDFGQMTLEFEGGLTATVAAGRTGWRSHPASGMNRVLLAGTKSTVCIDAFRPRWEVWADEPQWPMPRRHPEDPMGFWPSTQQEAGVQPKQSWLAEADESDVRHFLDCVEHGRASDVPVELAAHVLAILLAAYRSAATGQPAPVDAET